MPELPRKIAIDTGVFVALLSKNDPDHQICEQALENLPENIDAFTTESCLAEVSYLLPNNKQVRLALQHLITVLNINIVPLDRRMGLLRMYELMNKYNDLPMDFADATLVVACENLTINHVLTLDHKDFSIYRPKHCRRLKILPCQ